MREMEKIECRNYSRQLTRRMELQNTSTCSDAVETVTFETETRLKLTETSSKIQT